jgi:hypothetical protein
MSERPHRLVSGGSWFRNAARQCRLSALGAAQRTKSLNNAADLAESQLARAVQVARAPGFESDPVIDGAILQAIVANH